MVVSPDGTRLLWQEDLRREGLLDLAAPLSVSGGAVTLGTRVLLRDRSRDETEPYPFDTKAIWRRDGATLAFLRQSPSSGRRVAAGP